MRGLTVNGITRVNAITYGTQATNVSYGRSHEPSNRDGAFDRAFYLFVLSVSFGIRVSSFGFRACKEIAYATSLGLEAVLFVVVAVTYSLWIRSRRDASITTSIPARSCIAYFLAGS